MFKDEDVFNKGGKGLDDAVKKIAELADATDKLNKRLDDSSKAAKLHAEATWKGQQLREAARKMEESGVQTTKEKISFLRKEFEAQRANMEKNNKLTEEKVKGFNQLNVALDKMKASASAESIGKGAEKVNEFAKKLSNFMSQAGSETGIAVGLPMTALKAAGSVISTVGSLAGKGLQNVGGALQSFGSIVMRMGPVGAILGGLAVGIGAVVGYSGQKIQMISEATGKVINAMADGVGSVLMQMVELAIKLRAISWQIHDSMREADMNLGGIGTPGYSKASSLRNIVAEQLGLGRVDTAKVTKEMSAASFGKSITQDSTVLNMEVMKRVFGMGDYGFFGMISRMSTKSAEEVMGNVTNIFHVLRKVGDETKISLKDWSKAFTEAVTQGKRYLISEKETASVLMKFMQMQKDLSKIGIDSVSDMSKIVQNFQDFSKKLSEGEQAYFGMQAFGASDPFSGMLQWRYGEGAKAFYGAGNEIGIAGGGETGDALESRLKSLISMATSLGQSGNAEQDLYMRQKFFQSKGLDEQSANVLALKMDNIFSKENQKLLDETKIGASTQKEMMANLINSQEKHAKIQEGLLAFQLKLTQLLVDFAMVGALYSVYALQTLRNKDTSQIESALVKLDEKGGLSGKMMELINLQSTMVKNTGLSSLLSTFSNEAINAMSQAGDAPDKSGYTPGWKNLRKNHLGGYIPKYHDGGSIGSFRSIVKDNEAMFLGNIGASVVPEKNINVMTNEKLSSLIEGVRSSILSSAIENSPAAVSGAAGSSTDVNVNISGSVFAMNDFKRIIRDTVIEVLGGR